MSNFILCFLRRYCHKTNVLCWCFEVVRGFDWLSVSCRLKPCHCQDWYLLLWHVRAGGECWGGSRCGRKMLQTFICFTCGRQTFGINCYAAITHMTSCMCTAVHAHTCIHKCMHKHIHVHTCTCTHTHMQILLLRGFRKCSSCCGRVLKAVF